VILEKLLGKLGGIMSKLNLKKALLVSLIFVGIGLSCNLPGFSGAPSAQDGEEDPQVIAMRQIQNTSEKPVEISFKNGFPNSVNASVEVMGDDPLSRAENYLNTYSDLYLLGEEDFNLIAHRVGGITNEDVYFYQTYRGLPVYASQIVVSLNENQVFSTAGNLLHALDLDTTPTLTPQQAEDSARTALDLPPDSVVIGQTFLTVFSGNLLDDSLTPDPRLGWHVTFGSPSGYYAIIDAHSGEMLSSITSTRTFDYDLADADYHTAEGDCHWGTIGVKDIGDENGIFDDDYLSDTTATSAWRFGYDAYWWYVNRFNRFGFDNQDHELEVYIHATFDDGIAAYYPDCRSIDITDGGNTYDTMVHEYTHGVIHFTSDLVYANQPGALNESYSDVMGEVAAGTVSHLSHPTLNHMLAYVHGSDDNGEVHANGRIPSHAAFLIGHGGAHSGYNFIGIGDQKMSDLFYAVMISLPENASFETAANATVARAVTGFPTSKKTTLTTTSSTAPTTTVLGRLIPIKPITITMGLATCVTLMTTMMGDLTIPITAPGFGTKARRILTKMAMAMALAMCVKITIMIISPTSMTIVPRSPTRINSIQMVMAWGTCVMMMMMGTAF
jgi:hypothetical protein